MNIKKHLLLILPIISLFTCENGADAIRITGDQVLDGKYTAEALSSTQLRSNYPMQLNHGISQPIIFKLSLNGRDNEGKYGDDHYLMVPESITEFSAPLLQFGEKSQRPKLDPPKLNQKTNVHFSVDLRPVLNEFQKQGFYITPTNDTIMSDDFSGLYLAGGEKPLSWIWDKPDEAQNFKFEDSDQDSVYSLSVTFNPQVDEQAERSWELSKDLSELPHFSSPKAPILEAITNLALEEALLNVREDGAFSAGKEWPGVWTRDLSYAGQLSLAYLFPEQMKHSLRAKLNPDGRIIQDTGTGGSWPISSDRHIWTLAAWEVFLATGDQNWLDEIRAPIINALKEDILWNRDPVSGMLQGETSFEDWREQTYPPWMSPAEIHVSHSLSTNVIFKRALEIGLVLAVNDRGVSRSWPELITRLDHNILNHFWNTNLDAPSSYMIVAPAWMPAAHRDLLGESLGILYCNSFDPLSQKLVATYPRTPYGSPVISSQLAHSPAYHNQAIWPFVETYSLLAAKQAGDHAHYHHSFNGLIRAAAMFLTHTENYQYQTGRPDQTEINSDRQLWSVAGWLSAIYKGLFGLSVQYDFTTESFKLDLEPNNPFTWDQFSITNLNLHDTPIRIELKGSGSEIKSITVNGFKHEIGKALLLDGNPLDIKIELRESEADAPAQVNLADHIQAEIPLTYWVGDTLSWASNTLTSILEYNGRILDTLSHPLIILPDSMNGFFSLRSLDSSGAVSPPSLPYYRGLGANLFLSAQEPYYFELGNENTSIQVSFSLPAKSNYLLRFRYSNGLGPVNTGNTCGLAKLKVNDWWLEQMVSFPHTNSWNNWRSTAWVKAQFEAGENTIVLDQESLPMTNMNGTRNQFRIQSVEIIPVIN